MVGLYSERVEPETAETVGSWACAGRERLCRRTQDGRRRRRSRRRARATGCRAARRNAIAAHRTNSPRAGRA